MNEIPRAVLAGSSGVGKTSLVQRVSKGMFSENTASTIGAGVTPLTLDVDGNPFLFHIWDTAGQEIFRNVVPIYFRNATVGILVFSFTDEDSFYDIDSFLESFKENNGPDVQYVIVGNKADQMENSKLLNLAKDKAYALHFPFYVTSAATGQGIDQLFEYIGSVCASKTGVRTKDEKDLDLTIAGDAENKKKCCQN